MRFKKHSKILVLLLAFGPGLVSCTKNSSAPEPSPNSPTALRERGKRAYLVNCTSCHNADPTKDGVIGPSLAGSSLELVQKRLMEGTYPQGYTPKRATKTMVAMPHLKDEIAAIHSFLNAK